MHGIFDDAVELSGRRTSGAAQCSGVAVASRSSVTDVRRRVTAVCCGWTRPAAVTHWRRGCRYNLQQPGPSRSDTSAHRQSTGHRRTPVVSTQSKSLILSETLALYKSITYLLTYLLITGKNVPKSPNKNQKRCVTKSRNKRQQDHETWQVI